MTKEVIKEHAKELIFNHTSGNKIEFVDVVTELLTEIYELRNRVESLEIRQKDTQQDLRRHKMWEMD